MEGIIVKIIGKKNLQIMNVGVTKKSGMPYYQVYADGKLGMMFPKEGKQIDPKLIGTTIEVTVEVSSDFAYEV